MLSMGIDVGTTTVSVVMIDSVSGEPAGSRTIAHGAALQGHIPESKIQSPEKIWRAVWESVCDLVEICGKPTCIGLTGQMHGMLYVDADGKAVSPLYTWQDGTGEISAPDGKSSVRLLQDAGLTAAAGYGIATHFYLQRNGMIPSEARKMVTVSDYIGMRLCGRREPVIGSDMAASWGCFDVENSCFCLEKLERVGVEIAYLPEVLKEHNVIGAARNELLRGVPVVASLGDNQASALGSVQDLCGTVLVNVGTGSQVSVGVEEYFDCGGSIELRPCVEGRSLLVGSSLCGGRAYAMLERFYREAAGTDKSLYQKMEEQARLFRDSGASEWSVRTTFAGTRDDPDRRGSVQGIGTDNFCPGAMTLGVLRGILQELHDLYLLMCEKTGRRASRLVGSGNGIRRNALMRELAEEIFGMEMKMPLYQEEAACGAALHALTAVGIVKNMGEAQKLIRYCE